MPDRLVRIVARDASVVAVRRAAILVALGVVVRELHRGHAEGNPVIVGGITRRPRIAGGMAIAAECVGLGRGGVDAGNRHRRAGAMTLLALDARERPASLDRRGSGHAGIELMPAGIGCRVVAGIARVRHLRERRTAGASSGPVGQEEEAGGRVLEVGHDVLYLRPGLAGGQRRQGQPDRGEQAAVRGLAAGVDFHPRVPVLLVVVVLRRMADAAGPVAHVAGADCPGSRWDACHSVLRRLGHGNRGAAQSQETETENEAESNSAPTEFHHRHVQPPRRRCWGRIKRWLFPQRRTSPPG